MSVLSTDLSLEKWQLAFDIQRVRFLLVLAAVADTAG